MKNQEPVNIKFKSLLEKFQSGNCSLEELSQLEEMFRNESYSESIKTAMLVELQGYETAGGNVPFDRDQLFRTIRNLINEQKLAQNRRTLPVNWLNVAAMLVLAFIAGGMLSYFLLSTKPTQQTSYCEIVAPMGATSEVILPDSSKVWLNAGSKLRYSTGFNQADRLLFLEGEGYFHVAKNKQLPFIVDAYGFEIKAVGTEFNVKAYNEEPVVETTIVEGKVRLQHSADEVKDNIYLTQNQKATFFKEKRGMKEDEIRKKYKSNFFADSRIAIDPEVDTRSLVSWKEKRLIIEREQLGELSKILSRKYNYNFVFRAEEIKKYSFSGTLEDETLQQVMNVIKISSPIEYSISGKTVFIDRSSNRLLEFKKILKNQ